MTRETSEKPNQEVIELHPKAKTIEAFPISQYRRRQTEQANADNNEDLFDNVPV